MCSRAGVALNHLDDKWLVERHFELIEKSVEEARERMTDETDTNG